MSESFNKLVNIMKTLRIPDGCPWDQKQTLLTLRKYLIEETYEVLETMEGKDREKHCEELGDLLLQIIFQAQIAAENGDFTIDDVVNSIADKLTRRHPHVFGNEKADTPEKVLKNWAAIKAKKENKKSIIGGVPKELPALLRAYRVTEKAANVGFDWEKADDILSKLEEEYEELKESLKKNDLKEIEHEIGDMLMVLVNLSRHLKLDPEMGLNHTINKFIKRFHYIEDTCRNKNLDIHELSLDKMEELWQEAKKFE
ncbi:MAG: nucleoside triphosphate pyrophosphohydrolase [Pseudomonadota bacterium]